MPENEFERQVRQRLEELKLRPSGVVWEQVAKRIREKKRRRALVLLILLAGLGLLGYSGFTLIGGAAHHLSGQTTKTPGDSVATTIKEKEKETYPVDGSQQENASLQKSTSPGDGPTSSAGKEGGIDPQPRPANRISAITNETGPSVLNSSTNNNRRSVSVSRKTPLRRNSRNIVPANSDKSRIEPSQKEEIFGTIARPALPIAKPGGDEAATAKKDTDKSGALPVMPDSITHAVTLVSTVDTSNAKPALIAKTTEKKNVSAIRWSMDVSLGRSGDREHSFFKLLDAGDPMPDRSLPNTATGGSGGGTTFGGTYPPSDIRSGTGFKVGIGMELPLSPRISFVTGFRYTYLSNHITVGSYRDTSFTFYTSVQAVRNLNAVYGAKQTRSFTNRYHFIELPLSMQWQLLGGKKTALLLNTGVSFSYLLSDHSLVYDPALGGIYYKDGEAFHKLQVGLATGLAFRFGASTGMQCSIGPELSWNMNRQMKNVYDKNHYLSYAGITARLTLPKAKRK